MLNLSKNNADRVLSVKLYCMYTKEPDPYVLIGSSSLFGVGKIMLSNQSFRQIPERSYRLSWQPQLL